jgi:hypothetical protein
MRFAVGQAPIQVTALGRFVLPGNRESHALKLANAATGADVTGGTATLNTAGTAGGAFQYAASRPRSRSRPAPATTW